MSNTITAFFKGRVGVAESIYQHDYGRVLVIDGLNLPAVFEAHFTTLAEDDAITVIGQNNRVAIPDSCINKTGIVTVYIYLHSGENDGETEYVIRFAVVRRARPVYDATEEEKTSFDSAVQTAIAMLQNPKKVNNPLDSHNQVNYGTAGQLLRTKGDGSTEWVDEGLPTDEQTATAVSAWLDEHPEATTTVQDGSLTEVKLTDSLQKKTIKDYVTPQMFGAVADALYYHDGAWYKDSGFSNVSTDNAQAFQSAIDSGKPVLVPSGSYYLGSPIYIENDGVTLTGCGSEETGSILRFHETNGIVIASGYRLITVENICLHNDTYSYAGIEVSKQDESTSGSCHYLTVENVLLVNFKYGFCLGGYSVGESKDNITFLWNCSFKDVKISTFDTDGDNVGIRFFYNGTTNFGIILERVYVNGYKCNLYCDATKAVLTGCNFGINAVNAIRCETVSDIVCDKCNFECDLKVTGALYSALIYSTAKSTFIGCNFYALTDSNVSFIGGGGSSEFVFISNRYSLKTGNEMAQFFAQNLQSAKGSIVFAGGNVNIPRPNLFAKAKIQLIDLERSILPHKPVGAEEGTEYLGELQFDVAERTGGRPVWYDGSSWKGSPCGEWKYFDAVASGESVTYQIQPYNDRPRTVLITARGHSTDMYAIGIAVIYRGAPSGVLVPMYSDHCTLSLADLTLTITNGTNGVRYMFLSIIDLI